MTLFTGKDDRPVWVAVLGIIVGITFVGGALFSLHQHNKVGWDFEDACESTCAPYAHRVIDAQCECMDDEKRWVVQE